MFRYILQKSYRKLVFISTNPFLLNTVFFLIRQQGNRVMTIIACAVNVCMMMILSPKYTMILKFSKVSEESRIGKLISAGLSKWLKVEAKGNQGYEVSVFLNE